MEMAEPAATGQSGDASRQWVEQLDKNFPLDINNFCQWVKGGWMKTAKHPLHGG